MTESSHDRWMERAHILGRNFEERAADHDQNDTFVHENYQTLKENRFFTATIPRELGGDGVPHSQMCDILRTLAQYCSSTSLALSMHQHLLAANIWKYKQGKGGDDMLKKVAEAQLVLVSTGAQDWLESTGSMTKVSGGYRVSATKHFASQSEVGNVLVTSAPYHDPEAGWQVLHFPVPFNAEGVRIANDWQALGMRGTGSHSVHLDGVFVPESKIVLKRPRGQYHPIWNVILVVAMPLIMSVYVGIAEKAAQMTLDYVKNQEAPKPHLISNIGTLYNQLSQAQVHWKDMVRIANDYDFQPTDTNGHAVLSRKTNVAHACIAVVNQAMEIVGGQGFFRNFGLERLFRDVQGVKYHPLNEHDQRVFLGNYLLNH